MKVQHHHAHVASLAAEHGLDPAETVIGVAYDGTGYGTDRTIWGGEDSGREFDIFSTCSSLEVCPMPGGDAAIKRPYRVALTHLAAAGIDWESRFALRRGRAVNGELPVASKTNRHRFNCIDTSSMGRLFDAVASLLGICHLASYEGQAAIELEMISTLCHRSLSFWSGRCDVIVIDPAPVLKRSFRISAKRFL